MPSPANEGATRRIAPHRDGSGAAELMAIRHQGGTIVRDELGSEVWIADRHVSELARALAEMSGNHGG